MDRSGLLGLSPRHGRARAHGRARLLPSREAPTEPGSRGNTPAGSCAGSGRLLGPLPRDWKTTQSLSPHRSANRIQPFISSAVYRPCGVALRSILEKAHAPSAPGGRGSRRAIALPIFYPILLNTEKNMGISLFRPIRGSNN